MNGIRRWLARLGKIAAGLAALVVVLWTVSRLATPTAAQREALAVLERQPEYAGRNAFGLIRCAN